MTSFSTSSLASAAQQFSELLISRKTPSQPPKPRPCALRVSAGLHRGALLRAHSPMTIGTSAHCDVVLSDPEVSDSHAQLRRVDNVWVLVKSIDSTIITPFDTVPSGRYLRQHYAIGTAQIIVSQVGNTPIQATQSKHKVPPKAVALTLFFAAALLGAVIVIQLLPPASANRIKSPRSLAAEGWPDVTIVGTENAKVQVRGYVSDAEALKRLTIWIKTNNVESTNMTVRAGSDLVSSVKEALNDNSLAVVYLGAGMVRVSGSSENLATRERLSRIKVDLGSVLSIEDQAVFVPVADPRPREHILPIRIVDVRPGLTPTTGSFGAENNTRYFVGAVLPDGSEVVSIKSDSIEFSLGDKIIAYPLK